MFLFFRKYRKTETIITYRSVCMSYSVPLMSHFDHIMSLILRKHPIIATLGKFLHFPKLIMSLFL